MRDYKSMVAVQVMDELRKNNKQRLCDFELLDSPINHRDQKYRFWGERFDAVLIFSRRILEQKLRYIHENPVRKGLVRYPEDYPYSSAGQYLHGKPGRLRVDEILW